MRADCVARALAAGVYSRASSLRNPGTRKPHRAQIRLPDGWEYRSAEMASAAAVGTGKIQFDYDSRYGFLTYVAYGPHGIIDQR